MLHALEEDRLVAVGRSEGGGRREVAGKETARRGSPVARPLCRFRVALAFGAFGAFGPQLTAQVLEPLSPSELVFGEEIDVRVVNLEVVVGDREGNRVRGLSRDDFRILVDGEEVAVQYFSEVRSREVVGGDAGETPPAVAGGGTVATNYVLFVDDDHTQVTLRRPVLRGFGARLDRLGPQDRVAVVVMSQRRLEIVSAFTTDREATRAALAEFEMGGRYGGLMSPWAFRKRLRGLASSPSGDSASLPEGASPAEAQVPPSPSPTAPAGDHGWSSGARQVQVPPGTPPAAGSVGGFGRSAPLRGYSRTAAGFGAGAPYSAGRISQALAHGWDSVGWADSSHRAEDLRFSIDAVISTMRALEAPHGRKVLLLLAGEWPTLFRLPGSAGLTGFLWAAPGANLSTDLELLDELVDTANLLGYTVYPMDQQTSPNSMLWSNLRYVARDTGGQAFMAGSNVRALDKVAFDTANHYWLGFVPDYRRNNRAHDIRVEVREPRLRVRHRRGYLDLSRGVEAEMEVLQELLFPPEAEAGGGSLHVEVGDAMAAKGRTMAVPVTVHLPVGLFPAVPHDGGFRQQLEVRFATLDRFRRRSEIPAVALSLGGGDAPAPDEVVVYRTSLNMHRRPYELVVTVHDPVSRLTATGWAAIGAVQR